MSRAWFLFALCRRTGSDSSLNLILGDVKLSKPNIFKHHPDLCPRRQPTEMPLHEGAIIVWFIHKMTKKVLQKHTSPTPPNLPPPPFSLSFFLHPQ